MLPFCTWLWLSGMDQVGGLAMQHASVRWGGQRRPVRGEVGAGGARGRARKRFLRGLGWSRVRNDQR